VNEKIVLRFANDGSPMKVVSFSRDEGITFDKPKDASPLNIAFGLQSLLPGRLDPVRLRHDWRNKEFGLDATVDSGNLVLSGFNGDPEGLPFGAYDVTVEVESYRFFDPENRIVLKQHQQVEILLNAEPDNRRVQLTGTFDKATAALVNSSVIDGQRADQWLTSTTPREARKACMLNILTKLAARPMPDSATKSLTPRFESFHFADVDRVYAAAKPELKNDLEGFVKKKGWVFEGRPTASIHQKVVRDALKRFKTDLSGKKPDDFVLSSYRQGGRNSLQVVIAEPKFPHPVVYADLDIDLGNPLWNLDGFIVHLGELLDSARTDHFDLHRKLNKGDTEDFVFYNVVESVVRASAAAAG
jgi:hypothetical protein